MLKGKWLGLLLIVTAQLVSADVSGSQDSELLPRYPRSEITRYSQQYRDDYLLALGNFKRTGGVWRPEDSDRLEGDLTRITYRIPEGYSPDEVHQFWLDKLQGRTTKTLFSCEGRGCGSSHYWANNIFSERLLYGPDDKQRYTALKFSVDGQPWVAALYTIQRGNRRVYAHADLIQVSSGSQQLLVTADALIGLWSSRQRVVLFVDAQGSISESQQRELVEALERDPGALFYLVGHSYGDDTLESLKAQSTDMATRLLDELVAKGADPERLTADGVGPLAPGRESAVERIELLKR